MNKTQINHDTHKYELIIFDCDGTIADSEYLNCLSCSQIFVDAGFPQYTYDVVYNRFVGITLSDIVEIVRSENTAPVPDDMPRRFLDCVAERADQFLKPIEGVDEAIAWSHNRFKIAVASNGERSNVLNSVNVLGLKPYFPDEHVFTAIQVEKAKPAPDLFLYVARNFGVDPRRTLVIEDTRVGVQAAKAANMDVIGMVKLHQSEAGYEQRIKDARADHIINDWADFYAIASGAVHQTLDIVTG